jgi:hypothetical protein
VSGERARALLSSIDVAEGIAALTRFEAVLTLAELRRHDRFAPQRDAAMAELARMVLERWRLHNHARPTALAALVDLGDYDTPAQLIIDRLEANEVNSADLRVAARLLRLRGSRNSARWLHLVANHLEEEGGELTIETTTTIIERLRGRWLAADDFVEHVLSEEIDPPAELEGPIAVPGTTDLVVRPIKSRQQLDRFSHHLANCASTYLPLVRAGATRLVGVELEGTPIELIEIHPRTGVIKQWKAKRNAAPDPLRKLVIEPFLVAQGLVAP